MKPYPLFTLNHFTVPVTLVAITFFVSLAGGFSSSGFSESDMAFGW
jgi:beta-glucosidase/6-phospho-beta-glucosidase/beta-galactosidase